MDDKFKELNEHLNFIKKMYFAGYTPDFIRLKLSEKGVDVDKDSLKLFTKRRFNENRAPTQSLILKAHEDVILSLVERGFPNREIVKYLNERHVMAKYDGVRMFVIKKLKKKPTKGTIMLKYKDIIIRKCSNGDKIVDIHNFLKRKGVDVSYLTVRSFVKEHVEDRFPSRYKALLANKEAISEMIRDGMVGKEILAKLEDEGIYISLDRLREFIRKETGLKSGRLNILIKHKDAILKMRNEGCSYKYIHRHLREQGHKISLFALFHFIKNSQGE